ncbi:hypothetical protein NUC16_001969 [Salmonella enterica]|nr:hypothetical protein [Salmonella enterica]EFT8085192.1 hypothetical protein [Salmonella enterica]EFT8117860.1 hypothetical protein [Salmonella enterica]EGJ1648794.1 hypothetical protein [Salmonella enterica]EGP1491579.1 hypothetical protein [Salmonella enterica]
MIFRNITFVFLALLLFGCSGSGIDAQNNKAKSIPSAPDLQLTDKDVFGNEATLNV